jgi:hypothetical protein
MANRSVTLLSSASTGAAGRSSADQTNRTGKGVVVAVKITASSGTSPTLTLTLQGKDAHGGYYTILATTALAGGSPGTTYLRVYPGLTASANAVASDVLPDVWRVSAAIGGSSTPTVTFAVTASVLD